jgi:hypothetical protein
MFILLAVLLVVAWALGLVVFHAASAMIHILLLLAVVSIGLHFVHMRTRTRGPAV